MKRRRRPGLQRERFIMVAASVLVLSALTVTGFYVKNKNQTEYDGYVVDFTEIEQSRQAETKDIAQTEKTNNIVAAIDDLDSDPFFQEANSGNVQNPSQDNSDTSDKKSEVKPSISEDVKKEGEKAPEEEASDAQAEEAASNSIVSSYRFENGDTLQWPVVGNILINYSMDKTTYFATLEQYKYNPSIIIEATAGEPIAAAADGKIVTVFENAEIGKGVIMNIGSGYELTYGQLDNIAVKEGDVISKGQIVGYIAEPTIYYSVEGSNLYFKLTKDGEPVNPMSKLE